MNPIQRRSFLRRSVIAASFIFAGGRSATATAKPNTLPACPIVDTHQHLWSVSKRMPPWLKGANPVLRRDYMSDQYRVATQGLDISTVYMEVDMQPSDHVIEAEAILQMITEGKSATRAAVIGGRPADPKFADYLARFKGVAEVKGIRQVLHGSAPRGYCLQEAFLKGIKLLGQQDLVFDLCMRPEELADADKLLAKAPETRFVLDHCGNADPAAFGKDAANPPHDAEQWKRDIDKIAAHQNVICKISGIVARAPKDWRAEDLAPIVNHCLDSFGPDRVVFGSDWPVCLLGASLLDWVAALHAIISPRRESEQLALWNGNARKFYRLT